MIQNYKKWEMIIIDDFSTDDTSKILDEYKDIDTITIIHNEKHVGSALANIVKGIKSSCIDNETILIHLDGDDWFFNNLVLDKLNNVYQDQLVYMTYGDYQSLSGEPSLNKLILNTSEYRHSKLFYTSHLRTMKMKIWKHIKDKSLRDENGEYFKVGGDLAIMYILSELCGIRRIRFITELLCCYNDHNPNNEFKINMPLLENTREYIWNMPIYNEIIGDLK
jgi:glycosyltransferase involved in cell wall biosynthesis